LRDVKKVKSVALDASLLAEAEKEAERRGIAFSTLVEEALKLYLSVGRLEEKLTIIEALLRQCLEETRREPPQTPAEAQKPPQQKAVNNVWVDILRKR
jgi:dihydroxyacetone kinase